MVQMPPPTARTIATIISLLMVCVVLPGVFHPAHAQEPQLPSPLELDFFPPCACTQKSLPQPGTWAIEVQDFTMRDAKDSMNSHNGDDNGFFDADLTLRRKFCGEKLDFPFSAKPPLNMLVGFVPEADGNWTLAPGSRPMGGQGSARLTPRGGTQPPQAFSGSLASVSSNGVADFLFTLSLRDGETPGLTPSPVMDQIENLTGRRAENWPDLACWCRQAEQSYRSAWQIRQSFLDPALLEQAEGRGTFPGKIPIFEGQSDWNSLAAGDFEVRLVDTPPGENYQARVNEAANAQVMAENYLPLDHIYAGGRGVSRAAGTTLKDCAKNVPHSVMPLKEAASHIHEDIHVADCLRAKETYNQLNGKRLTRKILGEQHFAETWFNTPANLSDAENRAYTATMRFFLDFHSAHCRPIIRAFNLE